LNPFGRQWGTGDRDVVNCTKERWVYDISI
jgi:hypothetical protein